MPFLRMTGKLRCFIGTLPVPAFSFYRVRRTEQAVVEKDGGTEDDKGVGEIERRPVEARRVDIQEIHDGAVGDPVDDVAASATGHHGQAEPVEEPERAAGRATEGPIV